MMSDEIKEFSRDEASGLVYHGVPTSSMAPVQQSAVVTSAPVAPPKLAMPSKGKASAGIPDATQLVQTVTDINKQLTEEAPPPAPPSAIGGLVDQITSNWKPLAIGAGVGAAAIGAKRLLNRTATPTVEPVRIEPTFASDHEMRQAEINAQKPTPTLTPLQNLQQRHAELTAAVQGQKVPPPNDIFGQSISPTLPGAVANAPAGVPQANPQFAGQPANVPQATTLPKPTQMPSGMYEATWGSLRNQPTVGNTPLAPSAPNPPPSVAQTVATGGNINQAIQQSVAQEIDKPVDQTLRTGTGREVTAGQGPVPQRFAKEYKSPTDVPKGFAFLPGGQYIDVLRNDLGQGTYTQQFTGREFPQTYPEAVEAGKNINRELNRPTREQLKAQGAAMPETTEGIVRKVGPSKAVKVAGALGALVAIPDLAKAESAQQRNQTLFELLTPWWMTMSGAGQNEQALIDARLAEAAYARQVGGGRGVAPAGAYPQGGLNYNSPRIR